MTRVHTIDLVVLVAYLVLMSSIGAYFLRYIRAEADFLKGGNRVEWWVAGLASFMSGFSVWTFTGGAGFAYKHGTIGIFLLLLAVPAFAIGYFVFATRWRRSVAGGSGRSWSRSFQPSQRSRLRATKSSSRR